MIFQPGKYYKSKSDAKQAVIPKVLTTEGNGFQMIEMEDISGREYRMSLADFKCAYYLDDEKIENAPGEEGKASQKPAHYDTPIDTIDFMKANFSREAVEGFMRGNAIKYLQRAGKKGDKLDDLRKSAHYLQMLIEWEEEQ